MQTERLKFAEAGESYFVGRNGEANCSGIDVTRYDNAFKVIHFEPLTSKGQVGRCVIAFPLAELDNVISALTKLKDQVK